MRIGIAGINGRMGRTLVTELDAAGATLAGGIDPSGAPDGVTRFDSIGALAAACDAVIDFTSATTSARHAEALAASGVPWVLGTTGLDAAADAAVARAARKIAIVQAANFSPGVALILALAERLGAALPAGAYDAEILEMHHRQKVDAPSGTALALGQAVAAGRKTVLTPVTRAGISGARSDAEIGFASLRGGQVVGEHCLSFTAAHEQITLSHRAFDRAAFAAGAIRAAHWLVDQPPGLYALRDVLGL